MTYFDEVAEIAKSIDQNELDALVGELVKLEGRLFIAGLGGSAANASHAAADFRKLAGVDAICLSDNVADITAIANDCGWREIYALPLSNATEHDALLVLSVGGGTAEVSLPLVAAVDMAKSVGMRVLGIVGRNGGYTKTRGDAVVVVPNVNPAHVTPHTESFQSVILHYLVSHPLIQKRKTKW